MRLIVACSATAILMLAGLASVGYQPANARADGPGRDKDSEIVSAVAAGCVESSGIFKAEVQGGVVVATCRPSLGVGPKVKR
jgi:hypothetical protein